MLGIPYRSGARNDTRDTKIVIYEHFQKNSGGGKKARQSGRYVRLQLIRLQQHAH